MALFHNLGAAICCLPVLAILLHLTRRRLNRSRPPLPPGPRRLPLIGNLHQIPTHQQWLAFHEWSKEFGPVTYLNLAGQPLVVLSTNEATQGVLARRSSQYSDRPRLVFNGELVTKGMHMLLRPYDAAYRLHQRMQAPLLNPRAANCYRPLQDLESRQVLFDILAEIDASEGSRVDIHHHIERATASFIYAVIYGYRLRTGHEQEFEDAKQVMQAFGDSALAGANIVDSFPVLSHLPAFLAPWKKRAEDLYQLECNLHFSNINRGLKNPGWNFTKHYMQDSREARGMRRVEIAFDLGILADAALDTTTVALTWFVVAWINSGKRWVSKAQQLLDSVVGRTRLPQFEDRDNLTYIDAIVLETLRWRPVLVGGVPHTTKTEDTYLGYTIPAGCSVVGNHFSIGREEAVFGKNTDDFVPERWLAEDGSLKDLPQAGFGFGRRICTGRHIARNNLFIQVARILWALDVKHAVSADTGERVVLDDLAGSEGFIFTPKPFKVAVQARGQWVRDLVDQYGRTHGVDHAKILDQAAADRMINVMKD